MQRAPSPLTLPALSLYLLHCSSLDSLVELGRISSLFKELRLMMDYLSWDDKKSELVGREAFSLKHPAVSYKWGWMSGCLTAGRVSFTPQVKEAHVVKAWKKSQLILATQVLITVSSYKIFLQMFLGCAKSQDLANWDLSVGSHNREVFCLWWLQAAGLQHHRELHQAAWREPWPETASTTVTSGALSHTRKRP